jgi:oligosaccharide repeat unit polymerase
MTLGNYNPQTWGASTFAPILKAIPGARPWDAIDPFINTAVLTNVYTWLEPYYRDFRLPGVIIATLALGFLIAWLYQRRRRSPRVLWIQSAFLSTVFLAPFATKINDTLFLFELIVVLLLTVRWPKGGVNAWINGRLRRRDADPATPARSELTVV